jgi:hypothetical protein
MRIDLKKRGDSVDALMQSPEGEERDCGEDNRWSGWKGNEFRQEIVMRNW